MRSRWAAGAVALACSLAAAEAGEFNVFGPEGFVRSPGRSKPEVRRFAVNDPTVDYRLRVYNGDGELQPARRVKVALNGAVVLAHKFDRDSPRRVLEREVDLEAANHLRVRVAGRPGSGVTLVVVGRDDEPPSIVATVSPPPNAAGWHASPVEVSFECGDAVSGVASCPGPVALSTDGAGQVVSGTAVDVAGNQATASVAIDLDRTPPAIVPALAPGPNAAGWNQGPVDVGFGCSDATSGVATCSPPSRLSDEGADKVVTGDARDLAGNTASAVARVSIDRTPPTVGILSPLDGTELPSPEATVDGFASDGLSGIASADLNGEALELVLDGSFSRLVELPGQGPATLLLTAVDAAGNSASASVGVSVHTPPARLEVVAPLPGSLVSRGGWNLTLRISTTGELDADRGGGISKATGQPDLSYPNHGETGFLVFEDPSPYCRSWFVYDPGGGLPVINKECDELEKTYGWEPGEGPNPWFDETLLRFRPGPAPGAGTRPGFFFDALPGLLMWSDSGPWPLREEDGEVVGVDPDAPLLNLASLLGARQVGYELRDAEGHTAINATFGVPKNLIGPVVFYDHCVGDPLGADNCDGNDRYQTDLGPIEEASFFEGPLFFYTALLNSPDRITTLRAVLVARRSNQGSPLASLVGVDGETRIEDLDADGLDLSDIEAAGWRVLSNEVVLPVRQWMDLPGLYGCGMSLDGVFHFTDLDDNRQSGSELYFYPFNGFHDQDPTWYPFCNEGPGTVRPPPTGF